MHDTVVVTASAGALPGLADALRAIPVTVAERPLMHFEDPADWRLIDASLTQSGRYGAIAFTSPRAAETVAARIRAGAVWDAGSRAPVIWASGAATAAPLRGLVDGVRTPQETATARIGAAAALAEAMLEAGVLPPVLFPCGEFRRDELPDRLRSRGVAVEEIVCYRSVLADQSEARAAASAGTLLVVTSPRVAALLARSSPPPRPNLVAVGPTTAAAAEAAGWVPTAVASAPTTEAVAAAVRQVVGAQRAHG